MTTLHFFLSGKCINRLDLIFAAVECITDSWLFWLAPGNVMLLACEVIKRCVPCFIRALRMFVDSVVTLLCYTEWPLTMHIILCIIGRFCGRMRSRRYWTLCGIQNDHIHLRYHALNSYVTSNKTFRITFHSSMTIVCWVTQSHAISSVYRMIIFHAYGTALQYASVPYKMTTYHAYDIMHY